MTYEIEEINPVIISEQETIKQEEVQYEEQLDREANLSRISLIVELTLEARKFKENFHLLIEKEDKEALLQIEKDIREAFLSKDAKKIFIYTSPNGDLEKWCLFELGLSDERIPSVDKDLDLNWENYYSTIRLPSVFPSGIQNHKNVSKWIKARKNNKKREMQYNLAQLLVECPSVPIEVVVKELNYIYWFPVWALNLRQQYAKYINEKKMRKQDEEFKKFLA